MGNSVFKKQNKKTLHTLKKQKLTKKFLSIMQSDDSFCTNQDPNSEEAWCVPPTLWLWHAGRQACRPRQGSWRDRQTHSPTSVCTGTSPQGGLGSCLLHNSQTSLSLSLTPQNWCFGFSFTFALPYNYDSEGMGVKKKKEKKRNADTDECWASVDGIGFDATNLHCFCVCGIRFLPPQPFSVEK